MSNLKQSQQQQEEDDPYAVYSSDDEDVIMSDEDLDKMPGIYIDAPVIAKQLVRCLNKGCEGDALRRHSRDKFRWPDGAFCFKCRLHGKPKQKKEYPSANQDWQEAEFQATMKELKELVNIEEKKEAKRLHETLSDDMNKSQRSRSNSD
jgi:hypothetical protein